MMAKQRYTVLSLFSGAGGLDLGFTLTGRYDILVANDINEYMVRTYSINFKAKITRNIEVDAYPQVVWNDVAQLDFSQLKGERIDVVIGGPPCQDFSILRASTAERGGILVRRGRLYARFVRALATLQPAAFVFENVLGLVTANNGWAYKTIIDDFTKLNLRWEEVKKYIDKGANANESVRGYTILFNEVVDATAFGVAERRRRLIIIGVRSDLIANRHSLLLSAHLKKAMFERYGLLQKYPLTTLEVFEGKTLTELQEKYEQVMKEYQGVWDEIGTSRAYRWKKRFGIN